MNLLWPQVQDQVSAGVVPSEDERESDRDTSASLELSGLPPIFGVPVPYRRATPIPGSIFNGVLPVVCLCPNAPFYKEPVISDQGPPTPA